MTLQEELKPYRGGFVDGVGGYKIETPLPSALSRRARRADLVRRIRQIWYIKGEGEWKLPGDQIGVLERIMGRLRRRRPQTDQESQQYWTDRGGEGYEQEAFAADWFETAKRTFSPVWDRLRADGIRSILEVGCGPGRNLTLLKDLGVPSLLGLDFSYPQLQKARGRGFSVGQATGKILPVRSKSVDVVMYAQVLLHVPPPISPALEEAVRAARRYVLLMEITEESAGPGSRATDNPHCFRHDLLGHLRRIAPKGEVIPLFVAGPNVHLFKV